VDGLCKKPEGESDLRGLVEFDLEHVLVEDERGLEDLLLVFVRDGPADPVVQILAGGRSLGGQTPVRGCWPV
jgi:hypothetical protein